MCPRTQGSADARGPLARCPSGSASTSGAIEFCDIRVGRGREALAGDNVVVTREGPRANAGKSVHR